MAKYEDTRHPFDALWNNPQHGEKVTLVFKDGYWRYRGVPVDIYTYYRCEDCGEWTPPSAVHYCQVNPEGV